MSVSDSWLLFRELRSTKTCVTVRSAIEPLDFLQYLNDVETIVEKSIGRARTWFAAANPSTPYFMDISENLREMRTTVQNEIVPRLEAAAGEDCVLTKDVRSIVWRYLGPDLGPDIPPRIQRIQSAEGVKPASRKRKTIK